MRAPVPGALAASPRRLGEEVRVRDVVRPHRSGVERRRDAAGARGVGRPDARAERVGRAVGERHRLLLRVEGLHGHDGAEQLLVGDAAFDPLTREDRRLVEPPGQAGLGPLAARDDGRAVVPGVFDEVFDPFPLALRDHRAEIDVGIVAAADPQPACLGDELLRESVVERPLDVDPLGAGADLAAVRERPPERAGERAPEVAVGEDDQRILPAQLERHRPEQRGGCRRHRPAAVRGAGEDDLRDAVRFDERLPRLARAVDDAHEVRREAGVTEQLRDELPGQGRQLGRLEHGGVACSDNGCHLGEGNAERIVPRGDDADDAERLVQDATALEGDQARRPQALDTDDTPGVAADPASVLGRDEQLAGVRLHEWLPGLGRDRARQSRRPGRAAPPRARRSGGGARPRSRAATPSGPRRQLRSPRRSPPRRRRGPPTRRRASRG